MYQNIIDYLNQQVIDNDDYDTITDLITEFDDDIDKLEEFKIVINNNSKDEWITSYIQELIDVYPEAYFRCDNCDIIKDFYDNYSPLCDYCDVVYCDDCANSLINEQYVTCPENNCPNCEQERCYYPKLERVCIYCIEEAKSIWLRLTKMARKTNLVNELAKYKLKLRSDSKLCKNYINLGDNDIDYVVRRMCEMKYLFDYCDMKTELKRVEYELELGNIPDGGILEEAENNILQRIGSYPGYWPWMVL